MILYWQRVLQLLFGILYGCLLPRLKSGTSLRVQRIGTKPGARRVVPLLPTVPAMSLSETFLAKAFRLFRDGWVDVAPRAQLRLQRVLFVGDPEDFTVIDDLLEPGTFDLLFATSVETAYSEIVRASPDRVVLAMRADDEACLQLLAMLGLDRRTRCVPVTTCVTRITADREESAGGETERCFPPARRGLVMH